MSYPRTDWSFIRRNAWRWQGGERWSRQWTPLMVFVAQSNARGLPRLFGLFLHLAADAVYGRVSAPLLRRGMSGPDLGAQAHPLSLTALAWKGAGVTNSIRWWLSMHANRFARYNS